MGLLAALQAVSDAAEASILQAQIVPVPTQFELGWPTGDQLRAIMASKATASLVSVWPTRLKNATRFAPARIGIATQTPTMSASVSSQQLAFSGVVQPGVNIHTFVGDIDAFYQTIDGDTLESIAVAVAAAIAAADLPNCVATPNAQSVDVVGARLLACNIGLSGQATITTSVGRTEADVQVSVWSKDPILRITMRDAIVDSVGTALSHTLALPDGSLMSILYANDVLSDKAQATYNLFEAHIAFECEFSTTVTAQATPVEGTRVNRTIDGTTTTTVGS